jgi:hypothetical protein
VAIGPKEHIFRLQVPIHNVSPYIQYIEMQ